ncbi:Olfactory Receptor 1M1 [Manis pentadactyla]|nr:Olfactory Receptor 1M1 [Manis pentadactyla]
MYYLLSHLSLDDICSSTTTIPKMLVSIEAQNQHISYTECIAQVCLVLIFISSENFLLAAMANDHYVAICHPLRFLKYMEPRNHSDVSEFLLLGLTKDPELQPLLFGLFLSMYLVTILGNLLIILAVSSDAHLHTPMYFFLSSLSFTDICISTSTIPKMLLNIQAQNQHISYAGCLTQIGFVLGFGGFESCLLAAMAYDRYVAICHPLRFINYMDPRNHTDVSEFLLLGLTQDPELQPLLFGVFLSLYLVTVLGNLLIILAVISDPHLHTPMYFFLSHLSLGDICLSTTTIPKMLVNIQAQNQHISYTGCLTQICFVLVFIGFENCLLAAMAYDRYVAICHPLMYTVIMNPRLCVQLILLSLLLSIVDALLHSLMVLRLSFCTNRKVPHFFCELAQVIKLACSDTLINNFVIFVMFSLFGGLPLSGIIYSYAQIVSSVLQMPSAGGSSRGVMPMEARNHTSPSEFILMGLSDDPEQEYLLFSLFLCMYVVMAMGNLSIMLAISSDAHLHTPMYFFLANLSLVDFGLATNTVPKMLVNIQTKSKSISYACCLTQMYFFHFFGIVDSVLIAMMAYDRFVAICHPLHYTTVMSPRLCALLASTPWVFSCFISLTHILLMTRLVFCGNNELTHYFCDLTPLLRLSCTDTSVNKMFVLIVAGLGGSKMVCARSKSYKVKEKDFQTIHGGNAEPPPDGTNFTAKEESTH